MRVYVDAASNAPKLVVGVYSDTGTHPGTLLVRFRDRSGACKSETSSQSTLTALPATWTPGSVYTDCPISAFGSG